MNRSTSPRLSLAAACMLLLALSLAPSASTAGTPAPENKWRIECSEGANSDGEIVFRVTPKDGEPIEVRIAIKNGTSENAVARRIRDGLRAGLPKDDFSVEVDDGEDVLLKKRYGAPVFSLELVSNTAKSVRINLDRE
jgi:hypothetical protein